MRLMLFIPGGNDREGNGVKNGTIKTGKSILLF